MNEQIIIVLLCWLCEIEVDGSFMMDDLETCEDCYEKAKEL